MNRSRKSCPPHGVVYNERTRRDVLVEDAPDRGWKSEEVLECRTTGRTRLGAGGGGDRGVVVYVRQVAETRPDEG